MPQSIAAAIRYAIALLATIFGVLSDLQVEQVTAAVVTLVTVAYGLWRTHQLEKAADAAA